ncbi:MAG: 4-(cytidine 5'-diphospho)-2-C-methyl-D-erythritol kinase [Actinobacteria bacterium]|nr:MAG: 4-(cytidine 5'-diphospho)-2-C-methyl-D-erythritol kinase [Actinomycetota bacterium]
MKRGVAAAKVNLALVVGPSRNDGTHEVATVYQRITLADAIEVTRAERTQVVGFEDDTLVSRALAALSPNGDTKLSARITKRIPVAAGLGGGSADAAAALRLGNELLREPLPFERLDEIAARLGADVPFFLRDGPHLGTADGTDLQPVDLPQDYWILLVLPRGASKPSTAAVYASFDERNGADGFDSRRARLLEALQAVRRPRDLAALPPNDLASSPLTDELRELGAFRADVSGAGPAVYALFLHRAKAMHVESRIVRHGRTWLTAPAWYV